MDTITEKTNSKNDLIIINKINTIENDLINSSSKTNENLNKNINITLKDTKDNNNKLIVKTADNVKIQK